MGSLWWPTLVGQSKTRYVTRDRDLNRLDQNLLYGTCAKCSVSFFHTFIIHLVDNGFLRLRPARAGSAPEHRLRVGWGGSQLHQGLGCKHPVNRWEITFLRFLKFLSISFNFFQFF
jgi:hypothetical protein